MKAGVDFVTWLGSDWAGADLADVEAAGGECCWLRSFVLRNKIKYFSLINNPELVQHSSVSQVS